MIKVNKRYRAAREVADLTLGYPLEEAVAILSKMPPAKFDETVELSVHLGVDPRQSDQMIRGIVNLPNGSGKKVCVVVFTESAEEALEADADFAGLDDLVAKVKDGWLAFDVALATPAAMQQVRSIARILGPRGLMPNPRTGTVTPDVETAVKNAKAGQIQFRTDKAGIIHGCVGRVGFESAQIRDNVAALITDLRKLKPASAKGVYIKRVTLSTTMGAGVAIDQSSLEQHE